LGAALALALQSLDDQCQTPALVRSVQFERVMSK
jgi:hypothetical protein